MTEPKFTPGPWKLLKTSWENSLICAEDGTLIAICKIHADVTEDTQDEFEKIKDLNADLLTNAWQLPELRKEIEELKALNEQMREVLQEHADFTCESCVAITKNPCDDCPYKIIQVLRKAKGEKNDRT